jgi:AAA+ superfamily predicted ATPase
MKKGISFNHYSGINNLLNNPFSHSIMLSSCLGYLLTNLKFPTLIKETKKIENIFDEFVASEEIYNKIRMIIDQLKNPDKYDEKNIIKTKGCLVYGKPGTGKTLLARVRLI